MKENLPFFSHDNDASKHPKMRALIAQFGFAGYGRFWALNEAVAAAKGTRLDLAKKVYRADVAVSLQMTVAELEAFLEFLANPDECGLIRYENGIVITDRTTTDFERMNGRLEADAVRKRGNKPIPAETKPFPSETEENPSENRTDETRREEKREFDGDADERPPVDNVENFDPDSVSFDPVPLLDLPPGPCQKFTGADVAEVLKLFGDRAQEAIDVLHLKLDAGDYGRFARPWKQCLTWFAKESSPIAWLDRAVGRKPEESGPASRRIPTRDPEQDWGSFVDPEDVEAALARRDSG